MIINSIINNNKQKFLDLYDQNANKVTDIKKLFPNSSKLLKFKIILLEL